MAGRLASLHRVQLSASSDSALLDSAARRSKAQRVSAASSASAPVLQLSRPLPGAAASGQLASLLQQVQASLLQRCRVGCLYGASLNAQQRQGAHAAVPLALPSRNVTDYVLHFCCRSILGTASTCSRWRR